MDDYKLIPAEQRMTAAELAVIEAARIYIEVIRDRMDDDAPRTCRDLHAAVGRLKAERAPKPRYTIACGAKGTAVEFWSVHDSYDADCGTGRIVGTATVKSDAERIAAALNAAEPKP